jgi:ABC-type lipoprotein export system ATPase subunit
MPIELNKISPTYLEPTKINASAIWQQHIVFGENERIQIVAPSGSGKTSLIHFLYGLRKDYTGHFFYNKKNTSTFTAAQWSNLRANEVSIIFQDLRLFATHTVEENIEIKRILNPFSNAKKAREMAAELGIANKLKQKAGLCSFGEQQRVAIIRALQQPFKYLIMDEPFSHLDENNSKIAMQLIESEAKLRNATIILADLEPIPFFNATKILNL